ncbi:MAG: transposase [Bacteroidota bacterium]|nr:transposase [Bacteroidota bacterium]
MCPAYKIEDQSGLYFVTFTVVDWVDIFSRKIYRDIIIESLKYCIANKGLRLWGYVVMTNHMHAIISSDRNNLSDIIRDFKRHTASQSLKLINLHLESRRNWLDKRFEFAARAHQRSSDHQFWMHDNHPVMLVSSKFIFQKLNYIHVNPVRAGWVESPEDWLYSSARNYCNRQGLIKVDLLDLDIKLG